MYKSAIGFLISNLLMIWIVLLNNEGPGWEVPAMTMQTIGIIARLLFVSILFSFISMFIVLKKTRNMSLLFKGAFYINYFICIFFLIFLFWVDGFNGQFWVEDFPGFLFLMVSLGIESVLFTLISIGRFKRFIPPQNNRTDV